MTEAIKRKVETKVKRRPKTASSSVNKESTNSTNKKYLKAKANVSVVAKVKKGKAGAAMRSPATDTFKAFGIDVLKSTHKTIRKLKAFEDQPEIHGNKFWGSTLLIMDYFKENPPEKGLKVLEVGCGWGLTGIYFAKNHQAEVMSTDADPLVFPYLLAQADHNKVSIETKKSFFRQFTIKELSQYDLVVGADICFWEELTDELHKFTKRCVKAGVKKIVIADPERDPFFDLYHRIEDEFSVELESRSLTKPRRASGSLIIIDNS